MESGFTEFEFESKLEHPTRRARSSKLTPVEELLQQCLSRIRPGGVTLLENPDVNTMIQVWLSEEQDQGNSNFGRGEVALDADAPSYSAQKKDMELRDNVLEVLRRWMSDREFNAEMLMILARLNLEAAEMKAFMKMLQLGNVSIDSEPRTLMSNLPYHDDSLDSLWRQVLECAQSIKSLAIRSRSRDPSKNRFNRSRQVSHKKKCDRQCEDLRLVHDLALSLCANSYPAVEELSIWNFSTEIASKMISHCAPTLQRLTFAFLALRSVVLSDVLWDFQVVRQGAKVMAETFCEALKACTKLQQVEVGLVADDGHDEYADHLQEKKIGESLMRAFSGRSLNPTLRKLYLHCSLSLMDSFPILLTSPNISEFSCNCTIHHEVELPSSTQWRNLGSLLQNRYSSWLPASSFNFCIQLATYSDGSDIKCKSTWSCKLMDGIQDLWVASKRSTSLSMDIKIYRSRLEPPMPEGRTLLWAFHPEHTFIKSITLSGLSVDGSSFQAAIAKLRLNRSIKCLIVMSAEGSRGGWENFFEALRLNTALTSFKLCLKTRP